jgi:hypothetical protein
LSDPTYPAIMPIRRIPLERDPFPKESYGSGQSKIMPRASLSEGILWIGTIKKNRRVDCDWRFQSGIAIVLPDNPEKTCHIISNIPPHFPFPFPLTLAITVSTPKYPAPASTMAFNQPIRTGNMIKMAIAASPIRMLTARVKPWNRPARLG